jgi:hypothetical protein
MLSHVVPFTAPTSAAVLMKHLKEKPAPLRTLRREVPAALERIVNQALEKKPANRQETMADIANSLRGVERAFAEQNVPKTIVTRSVAPVGAGKTPARLGRLFENLGRKLRVGKHADAGQGPDNSQWQRDTFATPRRQNEDSANAHQRTALETIAITQPVQGLSQKPFKRKPLTLALGGLLMVALLTWAGLLFYRRAPQENGHSTANSDPASAKQASMDGQPVSVAISSERGELPVNTGMAVYLTAQYADGTKNEPSAGVEWTSSDPSVLVVHAGGAVEAKGIGRAEIAARYRGIEARPLTVMVTQPLTPAQVIEPALTSLKIQARRSELSVAERLGLRVLARHSDGRETELKKDVQWESTDSTVATVSSRGEVLGRKEGKVKVIARSRNIASEPLLLVVKPGVVVKPAAKERPRETVSKDLPLSDDKKKEISANLRTAKLYRERGEYSQALAELEKAAKMDPGNKEIQGEIGITRRACNAERKLGRSELNC